MSEEMLDVCGKLRDFLYDNVYRNEFSRVEFVKAERVLSALYFHVRDNPGEYFPERRDEPLERLCADFIAGMTDKYAINLFLSVFMPKPWTVL